MNTAMILAAGRGERLKILTENMPKALCPVNDIPVIQHHINNLSKAGINRIIVNHSYLGWKIRQHLNETVNHDIEIIYSPEPPGGLETGGGIYNALPLIGSDPFLVINADIFSDYDFNSLKLPENSIGHLVLFKNTHNKSSGDFGFSQQNILSNSQKKFTFTGIACYHSELFKDARHGRYSITPTLRKMADSNLLTGEVHKGSWFDIGTLEQLRLASLKKD
ncbi:MAG: nucleotidyltransferase family protein [Legionellaceae bacterium]|nr:nucleotidyltransferase family protein [Legionellaceae bacterium]